MTTAYQGFESLLARDWSSVRSRLDALAQRFVRRPDDAEAIALHAIDQLDPGAFAHDEAGARDAVDALRAAVREAAAEALSVGATPAVPTSIDESTLAAFDVASGDGLAVSPVREALGALPQLQRDAVLARVVTGYHASEVADALGVDHRTAAAAIRAGRRALRTEVRAVVLDRAGGEHARFARSSTQAARAHVATCALCHDVRHPTRVRLDVDGEPSARVVEMARLGMAGAGLAGMGAAGAAASGAGADDAADAARATAPVASGDEAAEDVTAVDEAAHDAAPPAESAIAAEPAVAALAEPDDPVAPLDDVDGDSEPEAAAVVAGPDVETDADVDEPRAGAVADAAASDATDDGPASSAAATASVDPDRAPDVASRRRRRRRGAVTLAALAVAATTTIAVAIWGGWVPLTGGAQDLDPGTVPTPSVRVEPAGDDSMPASGGAEPAETGVTTPAWAEGDGWTTPEPTSATTVAKTPTAVPVSPAPAPAPTSTQAPTQAPAPAPAPAPSQAPAPPPAPTPTQTPTQPSTQPPTQTPTEPTPTEPGGGGLLPSLPILPSLPPVPPELPILGLLAV